MNYWETRAATGCVVCVYSCSTARIKNSFMVDSRAAACAFARWNKLWSRSIVIRITFGWELSLVDVFEIRIAVHALFVELQELAGFLIADAAFA